MKNKKKRIKNRGFTITEVITTLVILGVVLAIAIPGVGKLQTKFKTDYYEQLDGSIVAAAKTYFKDNSESRPSGDLAILKLPHTSLIDSKYINSINKYNSDVRCDSNGYIAVLKVKDQYVYKNCMICGDEYITYDKTIQSITEAGLTEETKRDRATANICQLAEVSQTGGITTEYNTQDIDPLYLYSGNYDSTDLRETLVVNETISLKVGSDVAYSIDTGNKIYPKNITGIDLTKETIDDSGINKGIKVTYENSETRTIHVYSYDSPNVSNSNGKDINTNGIMRSSSNFVRLDLSKITFKIKDTTEEYPLTPLGATVSNLTPKYYNNNSRSDELVNYFYFIEGDTEWRELECSGKSTCDIESSKIPSLSSKIKFKMQLKTSKGVIYGKETAWYPIKSLFVVTFDANGGSIESGFLSKEIEFGKKYGDLPIATKVGHSFKGWYTEITAGVLVDANTELTRQQDHNLYAQWELKTYIVSLDANGGTVSPNNISVKYNQQYGTLPTPTRTGYNFVGWYTSLSGGTQATANTIMGDSNVKLYARWEAIPSVVTLDANGGSVSPTNMTVVYNSTYGVLPTPTRTGYTFIGWFDITYKNNPLNFYADKYGDLKNAFDYDQDKLWNHYLTYGNNEGRQISQYIASTKVTATKDHTLYAGWAANSYTVTLNANGGTLTSSSTTIKYGNQYGTLPEPTREGYVFNGWYTATSGGTQVTATTTMNTASNHTLYAQWTEIVTESITTTTCQTKTLVAGVYYIEIVGGGAGGKGVASSSSSANGTSTKGGNAARWAGYVYLPAVTSGTVCVGDGSAGTHGIGGTPSNGESSYISNSSGTKLIEAMGGRNFKTVYSTAVTNIGNGAVSKLVCNNVIGKVRTTVTYGYGGAKSGIGRYTNASDGKDGIIKYQYVKTLDSWNSSPLVCPTEPLCTTSACGWVDWPTS